MKTIFVIPIIIITTVTHFFATSFEEILSATVKTFEEATEYNQKVAAANKLSLIANKWPEEWASHYYVAYSHVQLSYLEPENKKKDAWLDKAEAALEQAKKLLEQPSGVPPNDEWEVMAANLASARLAVNPEIRWMQYTSVFEDHLAAARQLNEDNPRIYYLQGTSLFHTPKMFGGGAEKALPYFEKAAELFTKESGGDILDPYWGKEENAYFLAECKKAE